jgi:hypothetical protein
MNMSRNPVFFLTLFAVFAILVSAVAMWSDILKINATIKTGDVDIEFIGTPRVFEGSEYGKTWVANCSASLYEVQNEDQDNPAGDNDLELVITINNAYPCYYCKVQDVSVKNTGSVPVKLSVTVYANNTLCERKIDAWGQYYYACDVDNNGKIDIVLWGCFTSLENLQLHPGESTSFTVDTHVEQDAKQSSIYNIEILIKGIQWNEAPLG